jgi:hypothetical protein
MRDSLKLGRPDLALKQFEQDSHDSSDKVLTLLHRGMLKRMTGQYAESNRDFEVAKKEMQDLYTTSVSQAVGSVVVNDTIRDYAGDRYEQILLHSYMALNYIALGQIDAARVEVLQADVKMKEWGETPLEDPFVRYLSGIIFEALGEYDQAVVSYRKAVEVYKQTVGIHGVSVPVQLKIDFLRMLAHERMNNEFDQYKKEFGIDYKHSADKDRGYIVAILDSGLGPIKDQHTISTWAPAISKQIRIALPVYNSRTPPVPRARVVIDGESFGLDTVENIDGMARNALKEEMPAITLRAVARMVVKENAAKEAEKRGGGLMGLAFKLGGLVSEIADTRNWSSLPQEIQLVRVPVTPGNHDMSYQIISRSGAVIDTMPHPVSVNKGQISFVSDHWIAPRPNVEETQASVSP